MDRYSSARPMMAGKIVEIVREQRDGEPAVTLVLESGDRMNVGQAFDTKYSPEVGGYYVIFADGHKMYSSAEYFEAHHQKLM